MSVPFDPVQSAAPVNKPLWAAVGVLAIAVVAMGATLIRIQTRPEEPRLAVLSGTATVPSNAVGGVSAPALDQVPENVDNSVQKMAVTPVNNEQAAIKKVAKTPLKTVVPPAPGGQTPSSPAMPVQTQAGGPEMATALCGNCGTVAAVTPIQRDGAASGGGVIAGGVLGALVGNQMGGGSGKTLATVLGAVGGGVAGNAIEKKMNKATVYRVQLRMEDGSSRTVEQAKPPAVGSRVTVEGQLLRPAPPQ